MKGKRLFTGEVIGDRHPELKKIRAIYLHSLDLSLAMEEAIKSNYRIKNEHKEIVADFIKDLHEVKQVISRHQSNLERAIIEGCGSVYGDENKEGLDEK